MRTDICSIPVEEVFEPKDGCPLCRLYSMLEDRMLEYITGAAMMEPDVRKETNKYGFCFDHFKGMLNRRNRLGVALILDSHLAQVESDLFGGLIKTGDSGRVSKINKLNDSCFVCDNIEKNFNSIVNNIFKHYENEREFRALVAEQETYCLPHYALLLSLSEKNLSRRHKDEFKKAITEIAQKNMAELRSDVRHFCDMYDYRNTGEDADWGNSKDSPERSVMFLTSKDPEKK